MTKSEHCDYCPVHLSGAHERNFNPWNINTNSTSKDPKLMKTLKKTTNAGERARAQKIFPNCLHQYLPDWLQARPEWLANPPESVRTGFAPSRHLGNCGWRSCRHRGRSLVEGQWLRAIRRQNIALRG